MNLYITGGHLTPALAVIDALIRKESKDVKIFFLGRRLSQTFPPQISREEQEISKRHLPFYPVEAPKFHRERLWLNFFEILKSPQSIYSLFKLFRTTRPDVILSFGGYLALPACVIGKAFGARIITHEQTKVAGLANQVISYIADTIALASADSLKYFPKQKSVITGNPIRENLLREYKNPPDWFPHHLPLPFVYITGGSQGSQIINHTVVEILPKLTNKYIVIHQCGTSQNHTYLAELEKARASLPEELRSHYVPREWIEAKDVSYLLRNAKFVISRSGANTVEELTLAGTPAIFVPLAFAYNNEQEKNCSLHVKQHAGIVLPQKNLYPETLWEAIQKLSRSYDSYKKNALILSEDMIKDGTKRLLNLLTIA